MWISGYARGGLAGGGKITSTHVHAVPLGLDGQPPVVKAKVRARARAARRDLLCRSEMGVGAGAGCSGNSPTR